MITNNDTSEPKESATEPTGSLIHLGQLLIISIALQIIAALLFGPLIILTFAIMTVLLIVIATRFKSMRHPLEQSSVDHHH